MKKLFENTYLDHILKTILAMLLGWYTYVQIGIDDFIKYEQPFADERQNEAIKSISEQQKVCFKTVEEKNAMTQKRIDQHADKFNIVDRKLDLILYKLDLVKNNDLLISKNE